ncbi:MAG: ribonuclease HII [Flavobacteriales bacterium]|nr:ribonuclease HII [Flavobacteriales bacterium]
MPVHYDFGGIAAGCDEAGRGCLAGPVVAAACILPKDFHHPWLNDSKQITEKRREALRPIIEKEAITWGVSIVPPHEVDKLNILWASIEGMHRALLQLIPQPELVLVDGNRFKPYGDIPYETVVGGDGTYLSISAASVLAKTHRDELMVKAAGEYPQYGWQKNKGYPTAEHRKAIAEFGATDLHRKSFQLLPKQMKLDI